MNLPNTALKISSDLEHVKSVSVEISRNLMGMIISIKINMKPVEVRIQEELLTICPDQFDTLEELLSLVTLKMHKINRNWKNETIFLRSQLNLFEENQ
jgi:hypothetical protein